MKPTSLRAWSVRLLIVCMLASPAAALGAPPLDAQDFKDRAEFLWQKIRRERMTAADLRRWWNTNAGRWWDDGPPWDLVIGENRAGAITGIILVDRDPQQREKGVAVARASGVTIEPFDQVPKILQELEGDSPTTQPTTRAATTAPATSPSSRG